MFTVNNTHIYIQYYISATVVISFCERLLKKKKENKRERKNKNERIRVRSENTWVPSVSASTAT